MSRNRIFIVVLALLALFIQQGALLHDLDHALEHTRYSQHDKQHPGGPADVCDRCAAYAPGGNSIPPSPFDIAALAPAPLKLQSGPSTGLHSRTDVPYLSQAPPRSLA
ncbi:MAG: hypothetical protein PHR30_10945 [Gallionellaceae bacterium]|mgnify:CR=1 FL=1|nr:hypothetical protein [Gallionellaceae bacterium]MDD5365847.1 hypothetical protein [Gallionellaceae bacterium]